MGTVIKYLDIYDILRLQYCTNVPVGLKLICYGSRLVLEKVLPASHLSGNVLPARLRSFSWY